MKYYEWIVFISTVPLLISILRLNIILKLEYRNFFILICIEVAALIVAPYIIRNFLNNNSTANYLNSNIYTVLVQFFWLAFFYSIKIIKKRSAIFILMFITLILMVTRAIYLDSINTIFLYATMFSYIVIIFYSADLLSNQTSNYRIKLLKDPRFLIACSNLIFFTFQAFILILFAFPTIDMYSKTQIVNLLYITLTIPYFINAYAITCI